ncbi:response regulator [bacterium]|nr:response regulator [bacterium]
MVKKIKALVVDDNEKLRKNLLDILQLKGYDALGAENGYQAIDAVKTHQFDVILLDIKMPGMNGVDTLKILREIVPDIMVIMITAFADDAFYKEKLKNINFKIIQKPIDMKKLWTLLEKINN